MTVMTMKELRDSLQNGQRLIGLDLGTKTIGVAISDATLMVASPVETIRRTKFTKDLARLREIIRDREAGGLVIGLPVNMDGTEGPRAQSARQFATNCAEALNLPVTLWDERLSTAAVTRILLEADSSRKRRSEVVDKMAAAYILQGALDNLSANIGTNIG